MNATFENMAMEIIKLHIATQETQNDPNSKYKPYQSWSDYEVCTLSAITNNVMSIANQLAENYRQRAVRWDNEGFDRELEKALTTEL